MTDLSFKARLEFDAAEIRRNLQSAMQGLRTSNLIDFGGSGGGGSGGAAAGGAGFAVLGSRLAGLGVIAAGVGILVTQAKKMVDLLGETSSSLKGTMMMFGAAFRVFFKPFGDFLSALLRPMAILMIKMALAFNDFVSVFLNDAADTLKSGTSNLLEGAQAFSQGDLEDGLLQMFAGTIEISEFFFRVVWGAVKGVIQIDMWLTDFLLGLVEGAFNLEKWMWNTLTRAVVGVFDFAFWFVQNLPEFFIGTVNVVKDFWEWFKRTKFGNGVVDVVEDVWGFITTLFSDVLIDPLADFWEWFKSTKFGDTVIDVVDQVWGFIKTFFKGTISVMGEVWEFLKSLFITGGGSSSDDPSKTPDGLQFGGIFTRPTQTIIGESGPEAVIPLRGSGGGSLSAVGGGGSGPVNVTININGANSSNMRDLANQVATALKRELGRKTSYHM